MPGVGPRSIRLASAAAVTPSTPAPPSVPVRALTICRITRRSASPESPLPCWSRRSARAWRTGSDTMRVPASAARAMASSARLASPESSSDSRGARTATDRTRSRRTLRAAHTRRQPRGRRAGQAVAAVERMTRGWREGPTTRAALSPRHRRRRPFPVEGDRTSTPPQGHEGRRRADHRRGIRQPAERQADDPPGPIQPLAPPETPGGHAVVDEPVRYAGDGGP